MMPHTSFLLPLRWICGCNSTSVHVGSAESHQTAVLPCESRSTPSVTTRGSVSHTSVICSLHCADLQALTAGSCCLVAAGARLASRTSQTAPPAGGNERQHSLPPRSSTPVPFVRSGQRWLVRILLGQGRPIRCSSSHLHLATQHLLQSQVSSLPAFSLCLFVPTDSRSSRLESGGL